MTKSKTEIQRFFFISTFLILALAGLYIFQIVKLTETNYLIGKMEVEQKQLKKDTAQLEVLVSKDRNLSNLEARISEEGYQKISKINYIVVSEASVASAK